MAYLKPRLGEILGLPQAGESKVTVPPHSFKKILLSTYCTPSIPEGPRTINCLDSRECKAWGRGKDPLPWRSADTGRSPRRTAGARRSAGLPPVSFGSAPGRGPTLPRRLEPRPETRACTPPEPRLSGPVRVTVSPPRSPPRPQPWPPQAKPVPQHAPRSRDLPSEGAPYPPLGPAARVPAGPGPAVGGSPDARPSLGPPTPVDPSSERPPHSAALPP